MASHVLTVFTHAPSRTLMPSGAVIPWWRSRPCPAPAVQMTGPVSGAASPLRPEPSQDWIHRPASQSWMVP